MALDFWYGAVQWLSSDAATTTYVVDIGFTPKAVRFYQVGIQATVDSETSNSDAQIGVGVATSDSDRRCVLANNKDNADTTDHNCAYRTDAVAMVVQSGSVVGLLDIASFDSEGFTLVVDDQTPQSITVFYEAWGGSDIKNAATGEIAEPSSTGDVDYAVTGGFQPDVVMFAGGNCTSSANTVENTDFGICVGAASSGSSSNNYVYATWSVDNAASTDTYRYGIGGECLAMGAVGGGNPNARASLTQFNSDGFRLNWIARGLTGRKFIYLAIKGGSWTAGKVIMVGSANGSTAAISNGVYAPKGISMAKARNIEATAGTAFTTAAGFWVGTGISTSQRQAFGYIEVDNQGAAAPIMAIHYDQILGDYAQTSARHIDIQSVDAYGYTIVREGSPEGGSNYWHGYLMWGDGPPVRIPRGTGIGHPFVI